MHSTRRLTILLSIVMAALVVALAAVPVSAASQITSQPAGYDVLDSPVPVPTMINYQGYLTDSGGNPINDTLEMTFSVYEVAMGGIAVWTETHSSVTVNTGLFNVLLGSLNPLDASYLIGESYLGIRVGADPEMTPRQQIVSVAYAMRADEANDADSLDGMDSTEFAPSSHYHSEYVEVTGDTMTGQLVLPANGLVAGSDQLVLIDGKVGIGTAAPAHELDVQGTVRGTNANGNYGRLGAIGDGVVGSHGISGNYGQLGTSEFGVFGNSGTYGVYGQSTSGYGVFGYGDTGTYGISSNNGNYGTLGTSDEGVYGRHNASGNYGQIGTGNEGVFGYSSSGNGVYGDSDSSFGVYGYSNSGQGVEGYNGGSDSYGWLGGNSKGVYGYTNDGQGVYGSNGSGNYGWLGGNNEGVYGNGSESYGVYGRSGSNYGVYGRSTSSDGVYGVNVDSGNYGILGTSAEGLYGYGAYGSGDAYGVYGIQESTGNYGWLGGSNAGAYGRSMSNGVEGINSLNWNSGRLGSTSEGVFGLHYDSGNRGAIGTSNYGVYGWGDTVTDYDFYASGPGIDYGPFTGAHEVKLATDFPQDFRPGLIVSVTGETQVRTEDGEIAYSSTLPTVQLADSANDIKVAGAIISESSLSEDHWYQAVEGERFGIVNALGDGRVWVTNINGDIEAGNYITTSAIAGYGQKQDDDLLHAYTLGKATETVDWSRVTDTVDFNGKIYKAYPIAVFYTSG